MRRYASQGGLIRLLQITHPEAHIIYYLSLHGPVPSCGGPSVRASVVGQADSSRLVLPFELVVEAR